MPTVKADLSICQGHANCVLAAEDVFDIDDDSLVVVLQSHITEPDRMRVANAVLSCPVSALSLVEDPV